MSKIIQILSFYVFFFCNFYTQHAFGTTVGSNTVPSVAALTSFPAGSNTMLGFAAFPSGVTLAGPTTLVIFNDFFPVGGPITLAGGSLSLSKDLTLYANTTLVSGGNLALNGFSMSLPKTTSTFTFPAGTTISSGDVLFNSNVALSGLLTFTGVVTVEGQSHTLDCTNGSLICGSNSSVLLKNMILKNASGTRFSCLDTTGSFSLQDVTWILDANYTFSQGTLDLYNTVKITGSKQFTYTSAKATTVHSNSTLYFDTGMTFSYATTSNSLLTFQDTTGILRLYETTLFVGNAGLNLTKGYLYIDGRCPFINTGASTAQGFSIGDGASSANNVTLSVLAESGFNIQSGFFVYNNL